MSNIFFYEDAIDGINSTTKGWLSEARRTCETDDFRMARTLLEASPVKDQFYRDHYFANLMTTALMDEPTRQIFHAMRTTLSPYMTPATRVELTDGYLLIQEQVLSSRSRHAGAVVMNSAVFTTNDTLHSQVAGVSYTDVNLPAFHNLPLTGEYPNNQPDVISIREWDDAHREHVAIVLGWSGEYLLADSSDGGSGGVPVFIG